MRQPFASSTEARKLRTERRTPAVAPASMGRARVRPGPESLALKARSPQVKTGVTFPGSGRRIAAAAPTVAGAAVATALRLIKTRPGQGTQATSARAIRALDKRAGEAARLPGPRKPGPAPREGKTAERRSVWARGVPHRPQ